MVEDGFVVGGGGGDVVMCLMARGEIVLAGLTLECATVVSSVCGNWGGTRVIIVGCAGASVRGVAACG